jgi:hypothetical protein
MTGQAPVFPFALTQDFPRDLPESDRTSWSINGIECGHSLLMVLAFNKPLYETLRTLGQLTKVADYSNFRAWTREEKAFLTFGRLDAQHALLSAPMSQHDVGAFAVNEHAIANDTEYTALASSLAFNEAIRLAALIYSDMVTLPHPWTLGLKIRIARRMHLIWQHGKLTRLCQKCPDHHQLFIWLLWFGCFGAIRSPSQDWFEEELSRILQMCYGAQLQIIDYEEVREGLCGFLWWDTVCDGPGRALWARVIQRNDAEYEDPYFWAVQMITG